MLASDSRPKTPIFLHYWQAKLEARAGIELRKSAFFNVLLGKNWLSAGDSIEFAARDERKAQTAR